MRRTAVCCLALLLVWGGSPARGRAEDPAPAASPMRLFPIGALTMGRSDYLPRAMGAVPSYAVNDAENPLFGGQLTEPMLPVGTAEEVVELLRFQVAPASWESVAGASLRNIGNDVLVVRQEPEALDGIGAALFALEQRWLKPITLDVVAARLAPGSLPTEPAALAALAAGSSVEGAITLTMMPDQRVLGFAGREVAYLQEYDVEVAQKARISDPIVSVLNAGLQVGARASASDTGERVRVTLEMQHAALLRMDATSAGEDRSIESPVVATTRVHTTADLAPGAWTLLEGAAPRGEGPHVVFLARVRLGARASGAPAKGFALPTLESAGMTKLKDGAFSTQHLTAPTYSYVSPTLNLVPSNYTPPEPPELPEPAGVISDDQLIQLLRETIAPEAWGARGGTAEVRKGTLYVRAPEPAVAAVERLLSALEQALLWSVNREGRLAERPAGHPALADLHLAPEAEAALEQALKDGSGTLLERVRVSSLAGQRNNVVALEQRSYVADYEVELAEDATISNPVVLQQESGVVLDIAPQLTSTRDSVVAAVRFTRSVPAQALRTVRTVVGDIQCPDQRVHALRADVELPVGRTTLAASWLGPAGRQTGLFLTARLSARPAR